MPSTVTDETTDVVTLDARGSRHRPWDSPLGPRAGKAAVRALSLLAFLGVWHLLGDDSAAYLFPTPARTLAALVDLIREGVLLPALWQSNQALLAGFALAFAVSLPLGILLGTVRTLEQLAQPYLSFLLAAPLIAMTPIVQTVFGLTPSARAFIVFLFSFVYMTVNTTVGVRSIDPSLVEMSHSFGASRFQRLIWVILPGALPGIVAGIRLGLGRALVGMVIAELTLVSTGLGSLISQLQVRVQVAPVLAISFVIVLEGLLLTGLVGFVESRLARWKGVATGE